MLWLHHLGGSAANACLEGRALDAAQQWLAADSGFVAAAEAGRQ